MQVHYVAVVGPAVVAQHLQVVEMAVHASIGEPVDSCLALLAVPMLVPVLIVAEWTLFYAVRFLVEQVELVEIVIGTISTRRVA